MLVSGDSDKVSSESLNIGDDEPPYGWKPGTVLLSFPDGWTLEDPLPDGWKLGTLHLSLPHGRKPDALPLSLPDGWKARYHP